MSISNKIKGQVIDFRIFNLREDGMQGVSVKASTLSYSKVFGFGECVSYMHPERVEVKFVRFEEWFKVVVNKRSKTGVMRLEMTNVGARHLVECMRISRIYLLSATLTS